MIAELRDMKYIGEATLDLLPIDDNREFDCSLAANMCSVIISELNGGVIASNIGREERFIIGHVITTT